MKTPPPHQTRCLINGHPHMVLPIFIKSPRVQAGRNNKSSTWKNYCFFFVLKMWNCEHTRKVTMKNCEPNKSNRTPIISKQNVLRWEKRAFFFGDESVTNDLSKKSRKKIDIFRGDYSHKNKSKKKLTKLFDNKFSWCVFFIPAISIPHNGNIVIFFLFFTCIW